MKAAGVITQSAITASPGNGGEAAQLINQIVLAANIDRRANGRGPLNTDAAG